MKRLLLALALAASPLTAQTVTRAEFDSLKAEVAKARREVGPYGDSIPPASDYATKCLTLPNGRYSIFCRVQQIGLGIDKNNLVVEGFQSAVVAALDSVKARMTAAEARLAGTTGPIIAPFSNGSDLIIPTGRLIIGQGCLVDAAAKLQICSPDDATIHLESNLDGSQYQNSVRHTGELSLSDDGGIRLLQNGHITKNCFADTDPTNGVAFTNCKKIFDDPTREFGQFGPDSRAQWSWLVQKPGVSHEYTQDLVLRTYEDQKVITLESWRPGWTLKFATSTGFRTIDKWFTVPQQ